MKILIPSAILKTALSDLSRSHEFAYERVGYFLGDFSDDSFTATSWLAFLDNAYERSHAVGACIGNLGMKTLMSTALKTNKSFLQFHLHEFEDIPHFSSTDTKSLSEIIPALFRFSSALGHGGLIMGDKCFSFLFWTGENTRPHAGQIENDKIEEASNER